MATMSSREFNRDTAAAKRTAADRPVVITDRGRPSHVLLTWDEYRRLVDDDPTALDLLADDEAGEVELELPARDLPRVPATEW